MHARTCSLVVENKAKKLVTHHFHYFFAVLIFKACVKLFQQLQIKGYILPAMEKSYMNYIYIYIYFHLTSKTGKTAFIRNKDCGALFYSSVYIVVGLQTPCFRIKKVVL